MVFHLGDIVLAVGKNVGDDSHRFFRRINIGSACHVLFQDIVLDGAGDFSADTLFSSMQIVYMQ